MSLEADLGSTDIHKPLMHVSAYSPRDVGRQQFFVVTDGEVFKTDQLVSLARDHAAVNRCDVIGFGSAVDADSLKGLRMR
jgi:hypothetical protein